MKQKTLSKPIHPTSAQISESIKGYASSDSYLQAIINSLEDELMVIDRNYLIIQANNTLLKRHGKRRSEVIGRYCYNISRGMAEICRSPRHECPIRLVWETGKPARTTHAHVYEAEGVQRKRYLDIIASPIKDQQDNVIAVCELIRDVTEAKELEMKIAEAHRNLSAMNAIANVVSQSLDLDTILSSALNKTLEIMKTNRGGILLWDEEKQLLRYRVYHGLSAEHVQKVGYRLGEGIIGKVAKTGKALLLEDMSTGSHVVYPNLIAAEGLRGFACTPLKSKGKILGILYIASHEARKFSSDDMLLLNSIAWQIATAIENAKLHQEVQHKEKIRGELLQDIFSIQEEERRRIARELHDETSQILASLTANLEAASEMLPAGENKPKAMLKKAQALSIKVLDEMNRLVYELRPTLLDDLGLVAAIKWLSDNHLRLAGITVNLKIAGRQRRLPPRLETTLFRVVQEAFSNITRHASAKNASVTLHFKKSDIKVHVKDDGRGFDVEEAISSKDRPRGLGLLGMKERVELMKGTLSIRSRPSFGTEIDVKFPLNEEVPNG